MSMITTPSLPSTTISHDDVVRVISDSKGQFLPQITITRPCKVRKGETPITKVSVGTYRSGIDYDNMGEVQTDRANGDRPAENAGLPWGEWFHFPYSIAHKGAVYMRLYPVKSVVPRVTYYRDGNPITVEDAKVACLASEFPKPKIKSTGEVMDKICVSVKLENITAVGKVEVV